MVLVCVFIGAFMFLFAAPLLYLIEHIA